LTRSATADAVAIAVEPLLIHRFDLVAATVEVTDRHVFDNVARPPTWSAW
jgi:hypothetical protein